MDSDSFSFTISDSDSIFDDVGGPSSGKSVAPPPYAPPACSPPRYVATTNSDNNDEALVNAIIEDICVTGVVTASLINAAPRGQIRSAVLLARALAKGTAGDNVQPWDHSCDDAVLRFAFYSRNEAAFPGLLEHFSPRYLEKVLLHILQYWSDEVGRAELLRYFQAHPELSIRKSVAARHPLWAIAARPDKVNTIAKTVYKTACRDFERDDVDHKTLTLVADQLVQNLKHVSMRTRSKYAKAMMRTRSKNVKAIMRLRQKYGPKNARTMIRPASSGTPWELIRTLSIYTFRKVVRHLATRNTMVMSVGKREVSITYSFYAALHLDDLVSPTPEADATYATYWRAVHEPKSLLSVKNPSFILKLPLDGEEYGVAARLLSWAANHPKHPKRYTKRAVKYLKRHRVNVVAALSLAHNETVAE